MKQYLNLIKTILSFGKRQQNRTGVATIGAPGQMLRFDLAEGFPAITTRRLAFKMGVGELIGFLRAETSAASFRALGCKVWDQNANENEQWLSNPYREGHDHLGNIYGFQWRKWPAYKEIPLSKQNQLDDALSKGYVEIAKRSDQGQLMVILRKDIDQVRECLDKIMYTPEDRRILFHGWNPAQLDAVALPSCHLLYQFTTNVAEKELSLTIFIRSNDVFLGNPTNVQSGACLLSLFARLTGYTPRFLSIMIADAHIYENHLPAVQEQLKREPHALPTLKISDRIPAFAETGVYQPEWLDLIEPGDFSLENYTHEAPLTAPMAV